MVNYPPALDSTFGALAHPVRRAIVERLARGEASVLELAKPFRVSLPAISRHLRVLEEARLVRREREGRIHHMSLRAQPLKEAAAWIERHRAFWEGTLDSLEAHFTQRKQEAKRR